MDVLSHKILFRPGTRSFSATTEERYSVDFSINGKSLLAVIAQTDDGSNDYMGCLVRGFAQDNVRAVRRLTCIEPPDSKSGRVLLYICPECGDIGCGAYSAFVECTNGFFFWRDFAYENGYEDSRLILGIGPYTFEDPQYRAEIARAGSL